MNFFLLVCLVWGFLPNDSLQSQLSESGDEFDSFLLSRSTKSSGVSNSGSASQAPQLSPRRREQLERNADDFFAL